VSESPLEDCVVSVSTPSEVIGSLFRLLLRVKCLGQRLEVSIRDRQNLATEVNN